MSNNTNYKVNTNNKVKKNNKLDENSNFNKNYRYSRQILFKPIGAKGQEKLRKSKVCVIGCGGLGSVIISNLSRSGIGYLRIVDKDNLDITNLQRQILYNELDLKINLGKVFIAERKIKEINSEITVDSVFETVSRDNIDKIIENIDIILDATDNFLTRQIINEASFRQNIPWIFGSVAASYGMVFNIIPQKTFCFNCIFSDKELRNLSDNDNFETSSNVGILNTIVNLIASIQTTEALKYLLGYEEKMLKDLLFIDIWDYSFEFLKIKHSQEKKCSICGR